MGLETQPINRRTGRNATQAGRRRLFDESCPGRDPGGSSGAAKAAAAGSRGRKPMERHPRREWALADEPLPRREEPAIVLRDR